MTEAPAELAGRLLAGDRGALSRAITCAENGLPGADALLQAVDRRLGRALVVGITGPPGAGKSSLASALTGAFRRQGRRVAVLAVDPSSPFSGGAILGDRIRMAAHAGDDGVYVRSVAARGHPGGLSATAMAIVDLLDAAGWDAVIVEAVGAGQTEVDIAEAADVTLVAMPPGLGDEVQAIKAGILEVADILVVTKADLDPSGRTGSALAALLDLLPEGRRPAILATSSGTGAGIEDLAAAVLQRQEVAAPGARAARAARRRRVLLAALAARRVREAVLAAPDLEPQSLRQALDRLVAAIGGRGDAAGLLH